MIDIDPINAYYLRAYQDYCGSDEVKVTAQVVTVIYHGFDSEQNQLWAVLDSETFRGQTILCEGKSLFFEEAEANDAIPLLKEKFLSKKLRRKVESLEEANKSLLADTSDLRKQLAELPIHSVKRKFFRNPENQGS